MSAARWTILALLLVLAQGALDNYINLTVYLDIVLCLFLVLILPPGWGAVPSMMTGFILGLAVDILGNGITGMSAAALTAAGLFRRSIYSLTAPREQEKRQSIESMGLRNFVLYSMPITLICLTVYILLDSSGFRPVGLCLARLGISFAVNTLLMAFLYIVSADHHNRRR